MFQQILIKAKRRAKQLDMTVKFTFESHTYFVSPTGKVEKSNVSYQLS